MFGVGCLMFGKEDLIGMEWGDELESGDWEWR
jgi:hypothetical protein